MTENEAKSCIQGKLDCMNRCDVFDCKNTDECDNCEFCYSQGTFGEQKKAFEMAIQALEEIQQYRAIGTPTQIYEKIGGLDVELGKYHSIGTIEEFKALKEKNHEVVIGEWIDTQPECHNGFYPSAHVCSNCHDYYTTEPKDLKFCPRCGEDMSRLVDIDNEKFWDILFDEACVEGSQAERIENELNKINVSECEIRNKAIDEFAERLKAKVEEEISLQMFIDEDDLLDKDQIDKYIDEIAEQMKGGVENEV